MRILITGIAGFVGSSIARELLRCGYEIIGIDDFSAGYINRISDILPSIKLHIGPLQNILNKDFIECDVIINCAATAPLPANEIDHFASLNNNVATCGAIMQFASKMRVAKVIHFSSSAVYEGITNSDENPLSEEMELEPKLMYPLSKLLSEQYLSVQAKVHQIETFSLRLFNLYGPNQDYFRRQPPLIGYLLKNLIENTTATLYGTAGCRRDYVNINDLIKFIQILLQSSPQDGFHDAINVGSGRSYDVYELVSVIESVTNSEILYKKDSPSNFWDEYQHAENKTINLPVDLLKAEVNKVAYANISKAKQYGFAPTVDIYSGMSECYLKAKEFLK